MSVVIAEGWSSRVGVVDSQGHHFRGSPRNPITCFACRPRYPQSCFSPGPVLRSQQLHLPLIAAMSDPAQEGLLQPCRSQLRRDSPRRHNSSWPLLEESPGAWINLPAPPSEPAPLPSLGTRGVVTVGSRTANHISCPGRAVLRDVCTSRPPFLLAPFAGWRKAWWGTPLAAASLGSAPPQMPDISCWTNTV